MAKTAKATKTMVHNPRLVDRADVIAEYQAKLDDLADEDQMLKGQMDRGKKRRDSINVEVKKIFSIIGGSGRQLIPVQAGMQWDRRESKKGAGFSQALLEALMGQPAFRKLCDKETVYYFSEAKLALARKAGRVTDEMMTESTLLGESQYSLQITKQVAEEEEF